MRISFLIAFLLLPSLPAAAEGGAPGAAEGGAYFTGDYQNLFGALLGKSDSAVHVRLNSTFQQLFYGDDSTERVYYPVGADEAYIEDIEYHDVRTEGMSYGMMIAVQLDRKAEFDRLWKWAKTFMQHRTEPRKTYFAWHCTTGGAVIDSTAASDGEEWFVTALFLASARWGDGEGIFNYRAEAQAILDAMLGKEGQPWSDGRITNMFNKKVKQVVFVPTRDGAWFTDPSYHLPHFYELWGRWADKNNQFWRDAADSSRSFFKRAANVQTGLMPDYARFDGTPLDRWGGGSDGFRYDAWRVGMNVALDYAWFGRDAWEAVQSTRLLRFFHRQGIGRYGNLFTLAGKKVGDDHSKGLVAMNAAACLASDDPIRREFVQELWDTPVPRGRYRYYDGLLYMLGMLQVSGNFRVYEPAGRGGQPGQAREESYTSPEAGSFLLSAAGRSAPLVVSSQEFIPVVRAARDLQADIGRVTGVEPAVFQDSVPGTGSVVLAGTVGRSRLIDALVKTGKLDVGGVAGKWEACVIQVVEKPFPGTDRALVIAGSDIRGTVYGIYDLSAKIGVSPWYWWADVPVPHQGRLYVKAGRRLLPSPAVKYRGIFLNDEQPALSGWANEKFGGFNHKFYARVFELLLRLKGNYLWPAMWGSAFFDDDSLNAKTADEYGVVIGTSHHEPMMRAHDEWRRYGKGEWNYARNDSMLREFWRQGIRRLDSHEGIVTVGMRGDGDLPMTQGANIALLERIIRDQRAILAQVTGKDVTTIPQDWALYKEVQEYYDKGMRVPDDITLLLCDDNWGNLRKLPKLTDPTRQGGYGIYYHFDYVGGPRNYKWLNTNQISRTWEQMHLAYRYGVDRIWIVNVGDLKPMEFPIQFFLDYARDPGAWPAERLPEYARRWAQQQFGPAHAAEIAELLTQYTQYNSRRKPELLSPATYSLINFREAERVVADYQELARKAERIAHALPPAYQDAFFELVLHPILACSNLNDLYVTVGRNRLYAGQGRAATDSLAERARRLFAEDSLISYRYNHLTANGKWDHMMDQTHIGYTSWQQPDRNIMPAVSRIEVPEKADLGVAIEGSERWWPKERQAAVLPALDPYTGEPRYFELFNRGKEPFRYSCRAGANWLHLSSVRGTIESERRIEVTVDWARAPRGTRRVPITIQGPGGGSVVVYAVVSNPDRPRRDEANGFLESDGYVSIEAEHYSRAVDASPVTWLRIPGLGRTLSGMTPVPVTSAALSPGGESPRLEYRMFLRDTGEVAVRAFLSPTLNFHNTGGLRYGISFDEETPQIVDMHAHETEQLWERWVSANINEQTSHHHIGKPGWHVLKYWMVDPAVVLQKLVVETGPGKPCYLGPPESFHGAAPGTASTE